MDEQHCMNDQLCVCVMCASRHLMQHSCQLEFATWHGKCMGGGTPLSAPLEHGGTRIRRIGGIFGLDRGIFDDNQ